MKDNAMNGLSVVKQLTLLVLALGLWAFIIYIRWFATAAELLFIGASGLDKIAHTGGGVFLALLAEWQLWRVNPALKNGIAFLRRSGLMGWVPADAEVQGINPSSVGTRGVMPFSSDGVKLRQLIALILGLALGWELLEFLFDADTRFFYLNAFDLWFLDSLGDVVAAFLGGYGYWVFGMERKP